MADAQRLAEIREREKAATEGPWHRLETWAGITTGDPTEEYGKGVIWHGWDGQGPSDEDEEFIAHARSDIPWLRAKVEDLQTILKEFAFLDGITPDGIVDVEQFCARLRALAAKAAEEITDA